MAAKIEYRVIYSTNDYGNYLTFTEEVQRHCRDGWDFVGGICVCLDENGHQQFYQAMTRKKLLDFSTN